MSEIFDQCGDEVVKFELQRNEDSSVFRVNYAGGAFFQNVKPLEYIMKWHSENCPDVEIEETELYKFPEDEKN